MKMTLCGQKTTRKKKGSNMAKSLKDILNGVKSSKVVPGSTGKNPAVDYEPKMGDEQKFVTKHKTEKHADRAGNGDNAGTKTKEAKFPKQSQDAYEEVVTEKTRDSWESNTPDARRKESKKLAKSQQTPGHVTVGEAYDDRDEETSMVRSELKALADKATALAKSMPSSMHVEPWVQAKIAIAKDHVSAVHDYMTYGDHDDDKKMAKEEVEQVDEATRAAIALKAARDAASRAGVKSTSPKKPSKENPIKLRETEQVDEVLSKKADAGEWIKDFVKSDNPKFAGKSPEKRKQMAIAAYYAKQRNEEHEHIHEEKCSKSAKGKKCSVHGMDECPGYKQSNESKVTEPAPTLPAYNLDAARV